MPYVIIIDNVSGMTPKSELVIHPVRMRILGTLATRPMTTKALAAALPDVAQATLYRQVRALVKGKALEVVERRTVNGIVESTYATVKGAARFDRAEFSRIPPEDHVRFFGVFLGIQMADAQRYFRQPGYDTTRDGATYFRASLLLTDKEARALRVDLLDLMKRYTFGPGKGRRSRSVAVSSIPEGRKGVSS